jgi:hypothetical protein
MARVIHKSVIAADLWDIRYTTRTTTKSVEIIPNTVLLALRIVLLSSPVPAGEVSVADMMVNTSQERGKAALVKMIVKRMLNQTDSCALKGGRRRLWDCAIMYSANSL